MSNYKESSLEREFDFFLKLCAPELIEGMEKEFLFHPTRKWRLDRAWPTHKVAVACEGGIFRKKGGAHRSIQGILRDIQKMNAAVEYDWRILRVTSKALKTQPRVFFEQLRKVLTTAPQVYPGNSPDTPQERAAAAGWVMCLGHPVSTRKLASVTGLTPRAAQKLMEKLCRVLPIYERESKVWANT